MISGIMAGLVVVLGAGALPSWTFDGDTQGWVANSHLSDVQIINGRLAARAVDWDPFLTCTGLEFEAKPWQYVVIDIKADKDGHGELFWSGETTGKYSGFSPEKTTPFDVKGKGVQNEIVIFPFWQAEKTIRQLRLDLYEGAYFQVDSIRIMEWGMDMAPQTDAFSWNFAGDTAAWTVNPKADELFSPPINLAVKDKDWVAVTVQSDTDGVAAFLWATADQRGVQSAEFNLRAGPTPRTYNIEMQGNPLWHDGVMVLGIRLPKVPKIRLESIQLGDRPLGAPEIVVDYFGFEDAINRTGMPCRVMARLVNRGGEASQPGSARLVLSPDTRFVNCDAVKPFPALGFGETATMNWTVSTQLPGDFSTLLRVGEGLVNRTMLSFTKNLLLEKVRYVPEPRPIETDFDVCAYYFPGWNSDAKWDCIRRVAPIRKPALGYYDESNPECVDWQIKWAVENGIKCFLVDWYWVAGSQHLTHWFEAYRKAKYRDMLKVSIMWANHNPEGTHSAEDWRNVTKHWIENYFNLPAYYQIDGKPAVFIWNPGGIRNDLGGSDAVKASLDESQQMAKAAGYAGITFVAMGYDFAKSSIEALTKEGYVAVTTYHEWGANVGSAKRLKYSTVVERSPGAWADKAQACAPLAYYPVVDTGWDSRPWHGDKSLVIEGRTPELFENLLEQSFQYVTEKKQKIVVLGPLNEWGEGSYIEPCLEYGFSMYEAIRRAFGRGNPRRWPVNVAPCDLGLGPYDFPQKPPVSAWTFDDAATGWAAMMGVGDLQYADGKLTLKTVTDDPALTVETNGLQASAFSKADITMQVVGAVPEGSTGQLFWSTEGTGTSEPASIHFPLATDGQMHTYTLDLKANPRWRYNITMLRLDPIGRRDVQIVMDNFTLKP